MSIAGIPAFSSGYAGNPEGSAGLSPRFTVWSQCGAGALHMSRQPERVDAEPTPHHVVKMCSFRKALRNLPCASYRFANATNAGSFG
jgi:hypothetical protein